MPVGAGELIARIEDRDGAALVAAAPDVVAMSGPEWGGSGGDGAVAEVVEIGSGVISGLSERAMTGVVAPAEITPWSRIARRRRRPR
jgi:hypothetical protein